VCDFPEKIVVWMNQSHHQVWNPAHGGRFESPTTRTNWNWYPLIEWHGWHRSVSYRTVSAVSDGNTL